MKEYQIWLGNYNLGQGYGGPSKPELVAVMRSVDFKTACLKYELMSRMKRIIEGEKKGDLNSQDYPWWYNQHTISNSWTGKYYESEEEALNSF